MKKAWILIMGLLLVMALAACAAAPEEPSGDGGYVLPDVLVAGAETTYPPFEYAEGNEIVGFDVDLWKEIGERMGVEAVHESFAWDGLISGLMADKFDVIMSCMGINESRLEQIDFTIPYFYSSFGLAVNKDSGITSLDQVAGKIVGIQTGTLAETWTYDNQEALGIAELVTYDIMNEGIMDLQAGRIDAVFNDKPYLAYMLKDDAQVHVLPDSFGGDALEVGIGVTKENAELTAMINQAILDIVADGTYSEIYVKWFGIEPNESELPRAN